MRYYPASGMPADIYVGLLQVVQLTAFKYYCAPGVPADIYFLPLEAVQLTGMKYYLALYVQLTYMWSRSKRCS